MGFGDGRGLKEGVKITEIGLANSFHSVEAFLLLASVPQPLARAMQLRDARSAQSSCVCMAWRHYVCNVCRWCAVVSRGVTWCDVV